MSVPNRIVRFSLRVPRFPGITPQLNVKETSLSVMDLDSAAGTYIDGELIPAREDCLVDINSVITIGDVEIVALGPEYEEAEDTSEPVKSEEEEQELQNIFRALENC